MENNRLSIRSSGFLVLLLGGLGLFVFGCDSNQSGFSGSKAGTESTTKTDDDDDDSQTKNPKSKKSSDDDDDDADSKTDVDSDESGNEDIEIDEDEVVAKIPGVQVVRVGVNFEDLGFDSGNDKDYNDAVLCFEGNFKVEDTNVVSTKKQTVTGTTYSGSGCNHTVRVSIQHEDGTKEPDINFDSRAQTPVTMKFKIGSKLEVFMTPYKGCSPGIERNMHQAIHAKVLPDVCNNSGG